MIREQRKVFLRECARNWHNNLLWVSFATTGWQAELFKRYGRSNPNKGSKILTIGRVLWTDILPYHSQYPFVDAVEMLNFFEKLHTRYGERIEEKVEVFLGKEPTPLVFPTSTDQIQELLKRGFISRYDIFEFDLKEWVVWMPQFKLLWPQSFKTREECDDIRSRYGLMGTINVQILKQNQI